MEDVITYLNKYREETPAWLENYLHGEPITFKDIMSSRVGYYPGCGDDGTLMMIGNKSHSVHSFLYVDYGVRRAELEESVAKSIHGYHPVKRIEWQESDLISVDPDTLTEEHRFGDPATFFVKDEQPYYLSFIMQRDDDQDESRGAEHFVVTFLFADGIETYEQLFVKEYGKAPWLFLLQDHGWGGNYDRFGLDGKLDRIIRRNQCYPKYVILGYGGGTRIWRRYEQVPDVAPVSSMHVGYNGKLILDYRGNLYQYVEHKMNKL